MAEAEKKQSNRRISLRRPAKGKVKVVCYKGSLDLGANLALAVLDVSETGLRIVVTMPLGRGQEVLLLLQGQGNMRQIKRSGYVVWCVPTNDGKYVVGIRLTKYLQTAREPR